MSADRHPDSIQGSSTPRRRRWRLNPKTFAGYMQYLALRALRVSTVSLHGVKIPLSETISADLRKRLLMGRYEARERVIITERIAESDSVLELGTGIGFTATLCARCVGSDSVTTVEANPEMIPLIEAVFAQNNVAPSLHNYVVTADGTSRTFNITESFWSSSIHPRDKVRQRLTVAGRSFHDLVEESKPSFLLVDIEGGELNLISERINAKVTKLLIELHEHVIGAEGVGAVRNWIRHEGFRIVEDHGNRSVIYCERPAGPTA